MKKITQDMARNLSMVMDFYELTMSNGYFRENNHNIKAVFDVFYRKNPDGGGFGIFAGLEQAVDYILNLHFDDNDIEYFRSFGIFDENFLAYLQSFSFKGDMYAFPEGTVMYPHEPVITVVAPLIDAQLVETALLLQINHQSLIATKTRRIVKAAKGRSVLDFGARRAHNVDAAVYGTRAAYIGGAEATSTVLAGRLFNIPVSGTMAHSWVMFHGSEYEAFKQYAKVYPDNAVFLVDTYNVLESGVPNAIRVTKEVLEPMGKRLKGIRIDSGDLAYLSKKTRKMLDEAGLRDCKIIVSNSLDEGTIASLIEQGAQIDSLGVGERLITASSEPVFGAVYKIAAVYENGKFVPRIKVSENVEKITNPGFKKVYRVYNSEGKAVADLIAKADEIVDFSKPFPYVDTKKPWKRAYFDGFTVKELQIAVIKNGKAVYERKSVKDISDYVKKQLSEEIWQEEQRFENPHIHYLDMTPGYYEMTMELIKKSRKNI